jgi:hypothetical protein
VTERIVTEKTCSKCKASKPTGEFFKDASRRSGQHPWCKTCSAGQKKSYRALQPAVANIVLSECDIARFWSKVDIRGPDECWPWLAYRDKNGYGTFNVRTNIITAQRVVWWIQTGEWPPVVRHRVCDNPPCCNFAHLKAGTHADNMGDMVEKGRSHGYSPLQSGELHCKAKLTEADVRDILARYPAETQAALAKEKGVHATLVSKIVLRKIWKHLA